MYIPNTHIILFETEHVLKIFYKYLQILFKFVVIYCILSKRKGKFYKKQSNEKSKNLILFI